MDPVLQSRLGRSISCGQKAVSQKAATVDKKVESDQANKFRGLKQTGDSQKARKWSLEDAAAQEHKRWKIKATNTRRW